MKDYLNAFYPESPVDAARLFLVAAILFFTPFLWENGLWMPDRLWIDLAVFACAALLFADMSHNRLNPRIFAAVIVFIAVYWITSLLSNIPALSAIQLRLVVVGSVWALAIAVGGDRWRLRITVLLLTVVAFLLISQYLEFLGAFYRFGWDAFGIQAAGRLSNPNLLCALLLGSLPWTLVLWREGGEWGRRFSWGLWVGALLSFVIAGSRTGMVAVVITSGFAVFLLGKKYRRVLLIGAGIFFAAASLFYLPRFLSLFNPEHITNVQRLHMMRAGLVMGWEHPFVGWGPGTIGEVYPIFQTFDKWELHLHCLPLQIWSEMGIVGLLGWGLLLGVAGYEGFKNREDTARCAASISLVGILACQLTDYLFWIPIAFLLFWMNLGVLLGWGNGRSEGMHKGVRVLAPLLIGVVAIFMILLPEFGLRELRMGDSAMARENWESAIAHCHRAERLLGDHPLPPLLEAVARLRMTEGQDEGAFSLLEIAHARDPLCGGTLNLMGWSLVDRGFLDEAEVVLKKRGRWIL